MSNNPLKQYFRRPAIYITLPSNGVYYDDETLDMPDNNQIPIYPMTAIDEITSKTPDAVFNGQAVVDIIHSCVPCIKNAWNIVNIDLETILIAIRIASNGEKMEISSRCPSCKEESKYDVDLLKCINSIEKNNYEKTLRLNDLVVKFRPLTLRDSNKNNLRQYEVQKVLAELENFEDNEEKQRQLKTYISNLNKLVIEILADTIESISSADFSVTEKDYIIEYLVNCNAEHNRMIKDHISELKTNNNIKPIHIKCTHCSHEYKQELILNISDFFG
jgi:hypothetical protein